MNGFSTHNFSGDTDCTCSCKANYHTITTTIAFMSQYNFKMADSEDKHKNANPIYLYHYHVCLSFECQILTLIASNKYCRGGWEGEGEGRDFSKRGSCCHIYRQWNLSNPTHNGTRVMCQIVQDVRILRFYFRNTLGP